jgi:hypothetical protein
MVGMLATGMLLEHARAQAEVKGPLANAQVWHIGFVVQNMEKTLAKWDGAFQTGHTPIAERKGFKYPEGSNADPKTVLRTSEIILNGLQLDFIQPVGGHSPWKDHLDKHGDESLEHLAVRTKDPKGTITALTALGGKIAMGSVDGPTAYVDMPQLPFMIEVNRAN